MSLCILVESAGFPPATEPAGERPIPVTWDEILWAAVTVGRPNRQFVFRHGQASMYEALFRWSLVRMAIEQAGANARRLRRTAAARTLDPTEKGAVNYFLGMTFCKLFASRLLQTPWLLHLDVFRPVLNPVLQTRSRPDLVGQSADGVHWHAFECKGRGSPPDDNALSRTKDQARRLVSVNGTHCSLHVGAITYFRNDALRFCWRDPQPNPANAIPVDVLPGSWGYYYSPLADLITAKDGWREVLGSSTDSRSDESTALVEVPEMDLRVGVHPLIAKPLQERAWDVAHDVAVAHSEDLSNQGYSLDGIRVRAGESWKEPFGEASLTRI